MGLSVNLLSLPVSALIAPCHMQELSTIPEGTVLGLNFTGLHDSAVTAVAPDGSIVFACALERLSRSKKDGRFPRALLDQVPWDRVHSIGLSALTHEGGVELGRLHGVDGWPEVLEAGEPSIGRYPEEWQRLIDELPRPLVRFDHHLCHAASAYYPSRFDRSLVLTCDAGAYHCPWFAAVFLGDGADLRIAGGMANGRYRSPAGLYTIITALLGLQPNNHEGKVTGLAAHGQVSAEQIARFEEFAWPMVRALGQLMRWDIRFDGDRPSVLAVNRHRTEQYRAQLSEFSDAELAACVQTVTERIVLEMVDRARELAGDGFDRICLAGGLFANVRINQQIIERFDAGFVAPAMTDDGTALGAAILAHRTAYPDVIVEGARPTMFLGPSIEQPGVREALAGTDIEYETPSEPAARVAALLADHKVVAISRGAMEFGPRALGHRSILCRPDNSDVNDWLNKKLHRTEYMPFAPMTQRAEIDECYEDRRCTSAFMTVTVGCRDEMKNQCPAVVHVDGTARPQIVDTEDEPFIAQVLAKVGEKTGSGTVVNTSFNMHEEPMVCSAADSLLAFAQAKLDALLVGDILIIRAGNEAALNRLADGTTRARRSDAMAIGLSTWLSGVQHELDELAELRSKWFDPELVRLSDGLRRAQATIETTENGARKLKAQLAGANEQLAAKQSQVEHVSNEISAIQSSLTWRINRVFDTLRRGDFREFAGHVRGFLGNRLGNRLESGAKRVLRLKRSRPKRAIELMDGRRVRPPLRPILALRLDVAAALPADPPRVTAIIPCYNYARLVVEATDSLRAQTYPNLEIIVVNDGSTDETTLQALAEVEKAGIQVVHQENAGLVAARHTGARHATGEMILFLDNDDLLDPDAVSLLVLALCNSPESAFAYPQQRFFGDQELVWEPQEYDAYDLMWGNHPTVCSLIRKQAFDQVDGYNADMTFGWEDWEHWIALSERGHFGCGLPVPVFRHRRHGKTMTHTAQDQGEFLHSAILDAHPDWYSPEQVSETKRRWRPAVSVIVPFYNAHQFFAETMDSLKAQTFDDFEVLIVNDCSDDSESLALLDELRGPGDIRVIDRDERGDLAAARNTGVLAARSDFVFFLDPDDLIEPTALEKLVWQLLLHDDIGFVYSGVEHFGDKVGICIDEYDVKRLTRENFLTSAALVRRDVYLATGGMDETERLLFEDYDFWLRLAALGIHGKLLPEPLFRYRRHSGGRSAWVRNQLTDADMLGILRKRNPVVFGDASEHPPHYVPMAGPSDQWTGLLEDFGVRYEKDVTEPRESYRRPNVPNPFPARHWCDERLHVLYLIPHTAIGGAEGVDLDILAGLRRDGIHITLVVESNAESEWHSRFKDLVGELYVLPHITADKTQWPTFLEYLLMSRCVDVVFNRNTHVGYEVIKKWSREYSQVRFVDLLHLHAFGEDWVRVSAEFHEFLHRRYVITDDLLDYTVREYRVDPAPFRVIHCGVDTSSWDRDAIPGGCLRKELGIDDDASIIGFVGRLHEQKDPVRWVGVADLIAGEHPLVHFAMIGGGPLEKQVRSAWTRATHKDRIHLLGHRNDAPGLMADFNVLLLTSKYEGLPLVVFEAMSLGVSVVSTDAGGTRECVTKDTGVILPLDATQRELADAVKEVLSDPELLALRSRRCVELVRDKFDVALMQDRYRDELTELRDQTDRKKRRREYQHRLLKRGLL